METSVRYQGGRNRCAFPIVFQYERPEDVGVTLADAEGRERRLKLDQDYFIINDRVVVPAPEGYTLTVFLDAAVNPAADSARFLMDAAFDAPVQAAPNLVITQASARDAGPAYMQARTMQAVVAEPVAANSPASDLDDLACRVAELEAEREREKEAARAYAQDEQVKAIHAAGAEVMAELGRQLEAALNSAREVIKEMEAAAQACKSLLDKSAQSANDTASVLQEQALAASALYDNKTAAGLADLEMKAQEVCARQDALQAAHEQALAETARVNTENIQAASMQAARAVQSAQEQEMAAYGIQTQAAEASACECGKSAESAAQSAEASAASARAAEHAQNTAKSYAADSSLFAGKAQESAALARQWQELSEGLARQITAKGNEAIKSGWNIANQCRRPGLAAVKDAGELAGCIGGGYIINPFITQTPTMFYGIWPMGKLDAANWDGFFILGEPFTGLAPNGPELLPEPDLPDTPVNPVKPGGTGREWLPCFHTHQTTGE